MITLISSRLHGRHQLVCEHWQTSHSAIMEKKQSSAYQTEFASKFKSCVYFESKCSGFRFALHFSQLYYRSKIHLLVTKATSHGCLWCIIATTCNKY